MSLRDWLGVAPSSAVDLELDAHYGAEVLGWRPHRPVELFGVPEGLPLAFDSAAITALCCDDSAPTLPAREGVLGVDSVVHAQARVVAALDRVGPVPGERGRRS